MTAILILVAIAMLATMISYTPCMHAKGLGFQGFSLP